MKISIVEMKPGERGPVVDIQGGLGMTTRVQNMGIRVGKELKKVDSHFWRGPQTVMVDRFQVAIGHGMASRIFVEVNG